eukprot:9195936-Alexandrium_andersonii.AAC.1
MCIRDSRWTAARAARAAHAATCVATCSGPRCNLRAGSKRVVRICDRPVLVRKLVAIARCDSVRSSGTQRSAVAVHAPLGPGTHAASERKPLLA